MYAYVYTLYALTLYTYYRIKHYMFAVIIFYHINYV